MRLIATLARHGGCSSGSCGSGGGCGPGSGLAVGEAPKGLVRLSISAVQPGGSGNGAGEAPGAARPRPAARPFAGTARHPQGLMVGLDVGSTTVKAVVIDPLSDAILWKDYQRHETKQPEKVLEFLERIEREFGCATAVSAVAQRATDYDGSRGSGPIAASQGSAFPRSAFRIFMTGSGASAVAPRIGARFVQEVNAVSLAVEKLYPDVQSVVELGGQDAKIIVFKVDESSGKKKKIPSMNDKCAGGTGAVIDKINAKLRIPAEKLSEMDYFGHKLHAVAGKCGVFAETDINGLQKQGVPPHELMASLFESIIQQNLAVLTRGHTLRPKVLLLGGPNCYIRGMQECWRQNIPVVWRERKVPLPEGYDVSESATPEQVRRAAEELIVVPENAQYFAAIGAVEFGKVEIGDDPNTGVYQGAADLEWYVRHGRLEEKLKAGARGLVRSTVELESFKQRFRKPPWEPARFAPGTLVRTFLGIDGGSTSTKGVLLDADKRLVAKAYQLSKGNPIEDTIEIVGKLRAQVEAQGCRLEVLGVGTTGYAKDILKDVLGADTALVETVAHTQACLHYFPQTDVIVDVGGQDIKLIILKNGQVKDFKLNTQCSAGNGYFLQSTAQGFGVPVEQFADAAFSAQAMPEFGYGCAVFMQSDIVDFQRQGWQPNEIMAGLAAVLPKNIWLYVSQIPNLAKLGRSFVLQGGTQHNLAAVKAQVDFIESRFRGGDEPPNVIVHPHCGESGAIGCAIEAQRLWGELGQQTRFIGLERVARIQYRTTRNEDTRCYFCKNKCLRTFIDVSAGGGSEGRHAGTAAQRGEGDAARDSALSTRISAEQPGVALPVLAKPAGGAAAQEAAPEPTDAGGAIDLVTHTMRSGPEEGHPSRLKRGTEESARKNKSKIPLAPGQQRLIIATCEKGTVEDVADMRQIKAGLDAVRQANPNLVELSAHEIFKPTGAPLVADEPPRVTPLNWFKRRELEQRAALIRRRATYRIGIPRVLNLYSTAPFFLAYFESLGIPAVNLVFSDYTSEELYKEGAKRGAIDPCFPSKIGISHVHNLLYRKHARQPLNAIFFPMIDALTSPLEGCQAHRACPTVTTTPAAVKAAFTKEGDLFRQFGVDYLDPLVDLGRPLLCARQLAEMFAGPLGVTEAESRRAVEVGLLALERYERDLRARARAALDQLEREQRIGVVVLARPYHNDPGLNHEICDELQKLGYPVFTQDCLPLDEDLLDRLFGDEVRAGEFASPRSIEDVWKNSYSENTSRKIWAAKFAARHPNLVALELSSFKCGHDAPIYSVVEEIIERSGTPYFCFKDIDENKPSGSIKIRIETIGYFLKRYRERLVVAARQQAAIEAKLSGFEVRLRAEIAREQRGGLISV